MFFFLNFLMKNSSTSLMAESSWFFDFVHMMLLGILLFIVMSFMSLLYSKSYFKISGLVYSKIEISCILLPVILLSIQLIYGMYFLYSMSKYDPFPGLTIKVIGNQWYWTYEFSDIEGLSYDSFMKLEDDLIPGDYRLLSVDRPLVVPNNVVIRFCVTSSDVIHSFSMPSASIKVDAVPGIMNVVSVKFSHIGVYFGQCSEICGSLHSFMPIQVEVCLWEPWVSWVILNSDY